MEIDAEIAIDACLEGAGGVRNNEYFRCRFPESFKAQDLKITHLELWAVIIAVGMWGSQLSRKIIRVKMDNEAVSVIINSGRSKDVRLQRQLRELVWWLSKFEFNTIGKHLSRRLNKIPDILSRWHEGVHVEQEFCSLTWGQDMRRKQVKPEWFNFSHEWS